MRVSLIVVIELDAFRHKSTDCFAAIAAQTYAHAAFELILVDPHALVHVAAGFAAFRAQNPALRATLLPCPSTARAAGNNLGAAHATGEILIFLADDFHPSPSLVAAHAAYHAMNPDPDAVAIGSGLFPEDVRRDFFARWAEDSGHIFGVPMRRTLAVWPRRYFFVGNASIKRARFAALGGFDEHFPYDSWDDYEFGLRWAAAGGYSQFVAGAGAMHRHAVSFEERCASMVRAGESARVLERLHPDMDHAWRRMLRDPAQARRPAPAADAPPHARIAYYNEQLDAAFRRGYLAAAP